MNKYTRLGILPLHEVMGRVSKFETHGEMVKVDSVRMRTFLNNGPVPKCSACDLEAQFFAVERHSHTTSGAHLNLWGVNAHGKEVLFTHDHTIARGLGGVDNLSNTTVMCYSCNGKKAVIEHRLVLESRGELVSPGRKKERARTRREKRDAQIAAKCAADPAYAAQYEKYKLMKP